MTERAMFEGKVVVVTGAGRGMGRAIAQKFAAQGAQVAALDLNQSEADETIAELDGALSVACDVSSSASVAAAFAAVEDSLGVVDVLVNNAGIGRYPNDGSDEMYELMAKRNQLEEAQE